MKKRKKEGRLLHRSLAGFLVIIMLGTCTGPVFAEDMTEQDEEVLEEISEEQTPLTAEAVTGGDDQDDDRDNQDDDDDQNDGRDDQDDDNGDQDDDRDGQDDDNDDQDDDRDDQDDDNDGQDDDRDDQDDDNDDQNDDDDDDDTALNTKPEQVKKVSLQSWGSTAIKISWNPVNRADGYHVYRATSKSGKYKQVARLTGQQVGSYVDKGLTSGRTYYYKVRAFRNGICGSYSSVHSGKAVPKQAKINTVQSWGYNALKISWSKVSGAAGYRLYRATSPNGKYSYVTQINSGSTTSYVNSKLTTGQKYYYKMRSFVKYDGGYQFGAMSPVSAAASPKLKKAVITSAVPGYEKVTLKWNKVTGASGYQIYYREADDDDDDWDYVKTLKGTSYTHRDDDLDDGTYYYKVRAIRYVNGKKQYGTFSSPKKVRVPDYDDDRYDD